jgi:hypothetical protein
MPFELNPNSPIPGEFESALERSRRLSAEEAKGKSKQGPAVPERLKGPAGPPKPTSAQIANRPKLLSQEPAYVGGPASALTQLVNPLVEPIANFASMAGNDSIKEGWQGIKQAVSDKEGQILSSSPVGQAYQEAYKAGAGGMDDLTRGVFNLPTQVNKAITGNDLYQPVNYGLVPENNTTAGQALRTLTRYALSAAIPVPGVGGAVGLGVKAAGMRSAEGFVQGFVAASGDAKDNTFIGSIPGLEFLQTNEKYNAIQNRAVVGLEEALTNAGVPYLGAALRRVASAYWKGGKAALKTPEVVKDLDALDSLIPTLKYGGKPNEVVTDGITALTKPPQQFTVPFTAGKLPNQAAPTSAPINFKPVDMSSKNIQSINFENANGQPGFDLWFADKRFPALLPGTVKEIRKQGNRGKGYGNFIVVESIDPKTGEKVDVLYAHLADGGIKVKEGQQVVPGMEIGTQGGTGRVISEDGTIASVDFLAPGKKGSNSMKPYRRFLELRQELAAQIGKGGISPGQASQVMSDVAKALPTGQADEVIQETTEQLELLTRKQASEVGYEVNELIPVAPRNTPTEVMAQMIRNGDDLGVENSARKGYYSLTDSEIRIMGRGDEAAVTFLQNLAKTNNKDEIKALTGIGDQDLEKLNADAASEVQDFLGLDKEQFDEKVASFMYDTPEGKAITNTGMANIRFALTEVASQAADLAKAGINADLNGQSPTLNALRLIDRAELLLQFEKVGTSSRSFGLSSLGVLGKENDPILTKAMKAQAEETSAAEAQKANTLRVLRQFRDAIARGDEDALDKFIPAMKALSMVGVNPKKQLNVLRTLTTAVVKNTEALYTGDLLTGQGTQSLNFQSVLFNGFGQPLIVYLNKILPGVENKAIREEAAAAFSANISTIKEISTLIPKLWANHADMPGMLGKEFVGLDKVASDNMERVKLQLENGELSDGVASFYNFATKMHNFIHSPWITGSLRRVMGTADQFNDVLAGRQLAYRRAYLDARAIMGDAPVTKQYSDKFASIVEKQRKQYLGSIFAEDGHTLIDDEAKQLADAYAFRIDSDNLDKVTKAMLTAAEAPGMKLIGFTFVRSPAAIFRASLQTTPLISNLTRKLDKNYKNGSPYYKAFVDGANGLGWFLGISSYINGYLGVQSGAGPLRGQERKTWEGSHTPFTLNLPAGATLNYQWLDPLASSMGFFADLGYYSRYGAEQVTEDNFARGFVYMMSRILPAAGSNIINKSYFTQLAEVSRLTDLGNPSSYKKLGGNLLNGLVPYTGLRGQVGQVIDPVLRELRSELNNSFSWFLERKFGLGASSSAPPNLDDVTGKPVARTGLEGAGSHLLAAFNSFRPLGVSISRDRFKPVHKYLTEVGVDVADSKRKLLGQELTNEEMTEYTKFMTKGGRFQKDLLDYFNSNRYKEDKEQSGREIEQGYKTSETVAYQRVQGIVNSYAMLALQDMNRGLTDVSASFVQRRSKAISDARRTANQVQLTDSDKTQALANFSN